MHCHPANISEGGTQTDFLKRMGVEFRVEGWVRWVLSVLSPTLPQHQGCAQK